MRELSVPSDCTTRRFRFKCKHNVCIYFGFSRLLQTKDKRKKYAVKSVLCQQTTKGGRENQFPVFRIKYLYFEGSFSQHSQFLQSIYWIFVGSLFKYTYNQIFEALVLCGLPLPPSANTNPFATLLRSILTLNTTSQKECSVVWWGLKTGKLQWQIQKS